MNNISIGIPVYNNIHDLRGCIKSIAKNVSIQIIELIIVDDNSSENIEEFLKNFLEENQLGNIKQITYIKNKTNMGFPHNANIILENSSYNLICILNSDTYVCPNSLEKIFHVLINNNNVLAAGPSTSSANNIQLEKGYYINRFCNESKILSNAQEIENKYNKHPNEYVNNIHGFCYCIKQETIKKIGFFDEIYGKGNFEETDYNHRINISGYKEIRVKDSYIHHYGQRSRGIGFSKKGLKSLINYLQLLYKNRKIRKEKYANLTLDNIKLVHREKQDFIKKDLL